AAFGADLGAHTDFLVGALDQVMAGEAFKGGEDAGLIRNGSKILCDIRAVALGNACDDGFLRSEIAVEAAGTDLRFGADLLHGSPMEPGPGKAALGGVEDFLAAVGLALGAGAAHGLVS